MSQRFKEAEILNFAHGYCCSPALELQFGKRITGTLAFLQKQHASMAVSNNNRNKLLHTRLREFSARFDASVWILTVFILLNKTAREQKLSTGLPSLYGPHSSAVSKHSNGCANWPLDSLSVH